MTDDDPQNDQTISQAQSTQTAHSFVLPCLNHRSCPLCHVAMRERYAGILADLSGEQFAIEECTNCGPGRTQPRPVDMDIYQSRMFSVRAPAYPLLAHH